MSSSLGIETNPYIGVPVPGQIERPAIEGRFNFRELNGDRFEVRHPFHGTAIIGDESAITDRSLDAAAVVLFKEMPYLVDSMKLNRPRRYETRVYAGEYSQLSHCYSLGRLAVEFGGGPMDVIDALYNDASHVYNGHQGDDNYQGHGKEDLHDKERTKFLERAGILDALIDAGAFVRKATGIYFGQTRLTIDKLLSEEEVVVRSSFLSNKHPARRLDADRFQYNEEERLLNHWAVHMDMPDPGTVPLALAELSIDNIARRIILEDGEGDQLVFTNEEAALSSALDYVRHNSEHWCEPVQDLLNDLLNLAERYFFLCDHPHAKNFQYFYPHDYLHTSASLMFEQFDIVAKDDPVMTWFLSMAEAIAADQRHKSLQYGRSKSYAGPNPPDGIALSKKNISQELLFDVVDGQFIMQLPKGKVRNIDPRMANGNGTTKPLGEVRPEFQDFIRTSHQWIGDYEAVIEIGEPEMIIPLKLALDLIRDQWVMQLRRPAMPPSVLQRNIKEANDYVKRKGAINPRNGL